MLALELTPLSPRMVRGEVEEAARCLAELAKASGSEVSVSYRAVGHDFKASIMIRGDERADIVRFVDRHLAGVIPPEYGGWGEFWIHEPEPKQD